MQFKLKPNTVLFRGGEVLVLGKYSVVLANTVVLEANIVVFWTNIVVLWGNTKDLGKSYLGRIDLCFGKIYSVFKANVVVFLGKYDSYL